MPNNPMRSKDTSKSKNANQEKERKQSGVRQGIGHGQLDDVIPRFESAASEIINPHPNNSLIILGRDRPTNLASGYGAKGTHQCGRIDLIAGLASSYRHSDGKYFPPNEDTIVNLNFASEAARLYISQKADIDDYMGLAEGPSRTIKGLSTIALKADTIRMHSRYDIKIVTGRGKFEGLGREGERLSSGQNNEVPGTISFIAGNYSDEDRTTRFNMLRPKKRGSSTKRKLQPIPKGDNLLELMTEVVDKMNELVSMVDQNTMSISSLNTSMLSHTHLSIVGPTSPPLTHLPFYGKIFRGVVGNKKDKTAFSKNLQLMKINYLNPNFGSDFINSKFVFTT